MFKRKMFKRKMFKRKKKDPVPPHKLISMAEREHLLLHINNADMNHYGSSPYAEILITKGLVRRTQTGPGEWWHTEITPAGREIWNKIREYETRILYHKDETKDI